MVETEEKPRLAFMRTIKESWTYARLTEKEKENLEKAIYSAQTDSALKGTYKQRWAILQAVYNSFLMALDYNPTNWREKVLEEIPLF